MVFLNSKTHIEDVMFSLSIHIYLENKKLVISEDEISFKNLSQIFSKVIQHINVNSVSF